VGARVDVKKSQLLASPLAAYPFVKGGFVAVTRFAPPMVSTLEAVPTKRQQRRRG
jgi:hypothetical protein